MPAPIWPPRITLHKRSGQARIRVNGTDYYLGPFGSPEVRERYAQVLAELVETGQVAPARAAGGGLTVAGVIARWLVHARQHYSVRGREYAQFRLAVQPLERLFGKLLAHQFDADHLEQLQQALLTGSWMTAADRAKPRRPRTGGLSRRVANSYVRRVKTIWRWAERKKLVPAGSWAALSAVEPIRASRPGVKRDEVKPRSTSQDEVERVARHAPATVGAALLVQWWSGMRSGEARTMRAGDVAETGPDQWTYTPREHKTDHLGHVRVIILGPRAIAVLRPWLEDAKALGPDAAVFPSSGRPWDGRGAGECYTRDAYCAAVRRAARKAGLPGWHAYLCRHAARMRISREAGDEAARAVLGQRWLDTTLRYGELDAGLARDVQSKLG